MNFYVLEPEGGLMFGTVWAYADQVDPVLVGEVMHRCPRCGAPVSGGLEWLLPHRIKLSSAKPEKWGDFLWGAGFNLMVSGRFRSLYEDEKLTGILTFYPPAEIVGAGRKKARDLTATLPEYHLVTIKWGAANLDDAASRMVRESVKCSFCRSGIKRSWERLFIEPGSWDGSDIFVPRGLGGTILVSQRFKALAETHELKNTLFVPAQNYAYDVKRPGGYYW